MNASPNSVLAGRSALITGGSRGLGLAIATAYVAAGANVVVCARGGPALEAAHVQLAAHAKSDQVVAATTIDLGRPHDAERFVTFGLSVLPRIDILVSNAAVIGPIGRAEEVDWQGWREAVEINLVSVARLCRGLIPHMRRNRYGKILQISGGGATQPDPRFSAYAASKAGVVSYAATLAAEVRDDGIDVNCIAPGALFTSLNEEELAAGRERLGDTVYNSLLKRKKEGGTPLHLAAELAVLLASSATDGLTGKLISAVWDDWRTLPDRLAQVRDSDVYTLRRVTLEQG